MLVKTASWRTASSVSSRPHSTAKRHTWLETRPDQMTASAMPRGPIHAAQAVEYCAPDAIPGVGWEYHPLIGLELAGGVDQTQDSRLDQIVQIHVDRKIRVDTNGNGFH